MTLADLNAFIQSGVLSALALLIVYRLPTIWAALLIFIERQRKFQAEQTMNQRLHEDAYAEKMSSALAELAHSIVELKAATATICKYREPPNTVCFAERPPTKTQSAG